ncbi:hypothetical protein PR003_g20982 [Phytophthora rubi]|uniref:C2H2-type domain-containing protein n=1 Tax=Phytophthora rubi TaxID=129364 RepID=A0A6A4DS07_9STRA|nr:hypothetical protein PR001_g20347 [Phytophthora rubi]KAE9307494.1 hypothetical protein PR003_g20982 [Phytophthora rubi]
MTPKKQRKPAPDVAMQDVSEPKPNPRPRRAKKSLPTGKLEKFKEEQHLKIETTDLGEEEERDAESKAPPSSSKKRRRRAAEIDRKFRCPFGDCDKAYGSESSLNQHQKLKHPEEMAEAAAEAQETQVNTFPVHTRNVSIRPATPLAAVASDPNFLLTNQPTDDLSSASDIVPPSAKAPRCNMRSRSNSEPVSLTDEVAFSIPVATANLTKPRAKTPRKPRRAATPHPKKVATTSSSSIRRSKSESLPEMLPFEPLHELKLPPNHPNHDPILPLGSVARGSFEWPVPASGHPSTSLSSDDQAIDSDILSVLANCGAEDVGDPSVLDFAGPSSTTSFQSSANFGTESEDAEMLPVGMECFKISEHSTLSTETPGDVPLNEPEAELGLHTFVTLGDDWHLSSHLEKMSVATPPGSLESTFGGLSASERGVGRLRSASDPVHAAAPIHPTGLNHFSSMPLEALAAKSQVAAVGPLLQNGTNYPQWFGHSATTEVQENSDQQMLWAPGVATVGNPQPTSQTLDELLQHDDAVEWKAASEFEGDVGSANYVLGDVGMTSTLL